MEEPRHRAPWILKGIKLGKMSRTIRVNGRDLRAIAYGREVVWKCTLKRLRGLMNERKK